MYYSSGGDIGDVLRFELRPGGRLVKSTSGHAGGHRNSPAGPRVVRLQIRGPPPSKAVSSTSSRSPHSSCALNAERHPNADRRTTDRRLVTLDFTPPTSSTRMLNGGTSASGKNGGSNHGIVTLEVHYETQDIVYTEDKEVGEISRSASLSSLTKHIMEDDSSV